MTFLGTLYINWTMSSCSFPPFLPTKSSFGIFIISLTTSFDTLKKEKEWTTKLFKTDYINIILQLKDNFLPFHDANLLSNLSKIEFHVPFLIGLASMRIPKNVKDNKPTLRWRKDDAAWRKWSFTFKPKSLLFKKLTFKPDANSKPLKKPLILHKLDQNASPNKIVSLENCKISNWISLLTLKGR